MRRFGVFVFACALIGAACGTRSVEVADPADDDTAPAAVERSDLADSDPVSTSTSTTTTTTTTSTTTTTTPEPPPSTTSTPPLAFDGDGVPINGQSRGVVVTPTGWVLPVLENLEGGWRVWTPCGRETLLAEGTAISAADFVLDPGHGGSEPGAVGPGGTREADLNLQVAERVKAALEADGYTVVMTRDRDIRVPIVTRAEIALALDPIALISIHHNAGTDEVSADPGTEMWHQLESPESRRLAGLLFEETRAVLDPLGDTWFALSDAGAMGRANREGGDYYGMLRRPAAVPSVLAEFGYITNPVEEELFNRADVQDALAEAVSRSVARFTGSDDPGSGFTENPIFRGYGPSGAGRTTNCDDPALV